MLKVYCYKNCGTCKKALKWLEQASVEHTVLPIRETPPSVPELHTMLGYQGGELKRLFNTAGGDYRELNMKERLPQLTEAEALELLSERGNLVKRPFALGEDVGLVGFKESDWQAALC